MCNAWNHPAGCTCGWGGDGHLGTGSGAWFPRNTWGGGTSLDSPNAYCPECGKPVYFTRPQNGGSIWLDEFGPPWPKHPCMDTAEQRTRFPEPLNVPRFRLPDPLPPEWPNRYQSMFAVVATGHWSLYVGNMHFITTMEPPPAFSPIYLRWHEPDHWSAEVQYLSVDDGEPTTVTFRAYRADRITADSSPRNRTEEDASWEMLRAWIEDLQVSTKPQLRDFIQVLRHSIEWILDPGWSSESTSPLLVRARVEKACHLIPNLDPETLYIWIRLLFQ